MPKPVDTDVDPVVTKSLSVPLLISTLILTFSLVWAIYDEVYVMRPWKNFQADFIELYSPYLDQAQAPASRGGSGGEGITRVSGLTAGA